MSITLLIIWKILVFLLLIALPAVAMGIPFPLGLERLANHRKSEAAWACGINGCVSVVSTVLASFSAAMSIYCPLSAKRYLH